jgi:RNA polymerase sigma factor (sigma-70 family)
MSSSTGLGNQAAFQNTLWSQVVAAGKLDLPNSQQALEELCRLYWFPIYAFLRRWGHDREEARDLTQGFFAYLLEENVLAKADPDRGRFRSFLLGVLKNYVSNQQNWAKAIKRGGKDKIVSIDEETAEGLYANEPVTDTTPDKIFERRWALAVLEEAMKRLRAEYAHASMQSLFETLQPWLTGDQESGFAALGEQLGKSEGNARVLVHRLRDRFRKLIRAVIADTVSDVDQVELELQHLQQALRG